MNITIVGTGYVGLVSGTCFAETGITVTCVDVDQNKIDNVYFVNADLFDDIFLDEIFDFVWCNGVLHHTNNLEQRLSQP